MDPGHLLSCLAGPAKVVFGHCPAARAVVFARGPVGPCCAPAPAASRFAAVPRRVPLHLLTWELGTAAWPGSMKGQKGGREGGKKLLTKHI